ncbi:MAG: M23 family metallopeptidase, partial [Chloroflexi bacterium]|nr:M23 family metallopeptidase [Chloroflexota bacterium]
MKTLVRFTFLPLMVATLTFTSCLSPSSNPYASTPNETIENQSQAELTVNPTIEQSSISTIDTSTGLSTTPDTSPSANFTPEALQFVFPTPALASASAWRPPLYPTPWVPTPYDHFYFARPIAANEINWPLANYRYGGVFFENVVHTGIDIPVKTGTPVYAAGPGRINWAGYGLYRGTEDTDDPYGLAVVIRHDFGYQGQTLYTVYGHLSRIDVSRGEQVNTGDQLGLSGATGNVTGPHLHFEVRIGKNNFSRSRNPELWLSPPQGWGILAGRVLDEFGNYLPRQD